MPEPSDTTSATVIPLIDLGAWTANLAADKGITQTTTTTMEERKRIAQSVGKACREIGFFAIQNHGVNETITHQLWQSAREFFDLPLEQKLKSKTVNESEYPYGYEQSETLVVGKALDTRDQETITNDGDNGKLPAPDLKETFSIGPSNPRAGMPPRRYPESPKEVREALAAYYREMEVLALVLMRIFATALELPEDWFESKMDHHLSALRVLNYFEVDPTAERHPGQIRAGAHTDYGALSVLKSGGRGLQVKANDDSWVDVPNLPNTFIINLGDLMQRWTNDQWVSTLHRVVLPPMDGKQHRRQSVAYFVNVNGDAEVSTLDTCIDDAHPPKYPPILARDHLMSKHLASMRASETTSSARNEL